MPGQPDWQRYQTSAGPLIYNTGSNPSPAFQAAYMGSWRTYILNVLPQDAAALWALRLEWFEDAAQTQSVHAEQVMIGNNKQYIRQRPVLARYLTLSTAVVIPGTTNQLTVWLAPSLLDKFPNYELNNDVLISQINVTIPASTTTPFQLARNCGGMKKLAVWQTSALLRYNIRYFDGAGVLQYLAVLSFSTVNVINEYLFMSPETPVTVEVANTDGAAGHLLHIFCYDWA